MWDNPMFRKAMAPKRAKYSNDRVTADSDRGCALHSHRSKLEAAVCVIYQLRERAGELTIEAVEDHVLISGWYLYVVDFRLRSLVNGHGYLMGEVFYGEAKGFESDRWPTTKKGWRHAGPGKLEVWKGTHTSPMLQEVIRPR